MCRIDVRMCMQCTLFVIVGGRIDVTLEWTYYTFRKKPMCIRDMKTGPMPYVCPIQFIYINVPCIDLSILFKCQI